MNNRNLPDFLIVGGMKCGSTSLRHWLMTSSEIMMPEKETHFFSVNKQYEKGEEYYKQLLPEKLNERQLLGEDTPTYSYSEVAPARIHEMLPNAKLLWILRDPMQRAVSQYWHAYRTGRETKSIDEAFLYELEGKTQDRLRLFIERSLYLKQIKRYLDYFPRTQLHFVDFDKFTKNGSEERRRICDFLGIGSIDTTVPHSNKTKVGNKKKPVLKEEIYKMAESRLRRDYDELYSLTNISIFKQ